MFTILAGPGTLFLPEPCVSSIPTIIRLLDLQQLAILENPAW